MANTLDTVRELVTELEYRFPYAAALLTGATGIQIRDTGGEQNASQQNPTRGIVFTVYDGQTFEELATSDLAPDSLARAVRQWAEALNVYAGGPRIVGAGHATTLGLDPKVFRASLQIDPAHVSLAEKLAHVRGVQSRAQSHDPRVVQAQVIYRESALENTYIGRGRHLEQQLTRTQLALVVIVSDGTQMRYHMLSHAGTVGYEMAQIRDEEIAEVAETALRLLSAGKIEPGEYDIVTDPGVSGTIAHESFGHGVELDLFPKGRARAAHYLDQRVAAPVVQIFDDPSLPGALGSYFFDDEGELARPTQIMRDGIFVRPISDFSSATYAPGVHTPNGRRQDFTRKVYARMTNTFFGRGETPPEEIIAGVERGVYLRAMESGMEDPMGWGVQVTAHYGEEIVHGRLTGRLYSPVAITGYVPDLLASVSAVGNDFDLTPGTCGKGHKEMVPTTVGGPHMRMRARLG
ncbi:MAG TPA: TldD/PmbA family protein [Ktedonobacterales bacterium]|nr:TldD/PmbA family protein [Ktedonobacterales bacterium]